MQIDAVEQWAGDAGAVAGDLVGGATTAAGGIAQAAAGAGLRCLFAICSCFA
jgi:hypothetical protein